MSRILVFLLCLSMGAGAQDSLPGIHSHNDYVQAEPFWAAWRSEAASIEADIFLDGGELIVAHDSFQVKKRHRLDSLYLQPLLESIRLNKGTVYASAHLRLYFMIDIKTAMHSTLSALVNLLSGYPALLTNSTLRIVITGNRPAPASFADWPSWMWFDGDLNARYSAVQLTRVPFFSTNFRLYSSWRGEGAVPAADMDRLLSAVALAASYSKGIRFWNAPDNASAWSQLRRLGVMLINTDHPAGLRSFLRD